MKSRIELIYDSDCPNVTEARAVLLKAFARVGLPAAWTEWERNAPESPKYARQYGSPTILVRGKDVAGARPGDLAGCCRIYGQGPGASRTVPSMNQVVAALGNSSRRSTLLALPGIAALWAPVGVCPACWPVYTGLLASAGFGVLLDAAYLLPLVAVLLCIALAPLAQAARLRGQWGPLGLGAAGAGLALFGKFVVSMDPLLYGGIALLVGASLWKVRTPPRAVAGSCPQCALRAWEGSGNENLGKGN